MVIEQSKSAKKNKKANVVTKYISLTWQEVWSVMHKYSNDSMPYTNHTQYHQGEKHILVLKDKSQTQFNTYFFFKNFQTIEYCITVLLS